MVFQVPEWDDGSQIKNTVTKVKESFNGKKQKPSPKISSAKAKQKKAAGSAHVVADNSKIINREKKPKKNKNQQDHGNNNGDSKSEEKRIRQVNGVSNTSSQNETNKKITKFKRKNNKDTSDGSIKVENIDVEKLDEAILNAKKKKFNEALKRDDVEDLLFLELSPQGKKKPAEKTRQNNVLNGDKKSKNPEITKTQKNNENKTLNNKIVKAKNSGVKSVITKDKVKAHKLVVNTEMCEHSVNHNSERKLKPMDRKKKKIKSIIAAESTRNPINFNRNKLRERMLDRLKSAQFRFLNEKLYTSTGSEAAELFRSDPAAFHIYHQGYQQQVKKWPVNPLDVIVKRILKMPKSHTIADMGCGSAALSSRVPHAVRSFDLVSHAPCVEACDMARTPLLAESVDAAVYCLALMGTDLTAYLVEANRVLKTGGHLLIAEVESRFSDVNEFTKAVQKLGFKLKSLDREHQVFFYMEFVKTTSAPHKKAKQPVITLKPCIYKRR